jgi:hypothetical protein
MDDNRTPVTEARFALTILICVLVAVGYVVLLRLSGPSDSPMEVSKPVTPIETVDETTPLVLPSDTQKPQMSKRPTELTMPSANKYGVLPASGNELQRR